MKPFRSSRHLAWIRTLPCVVCRSTRGVEAAHTGPHGMSQKAPDTSAIPLCARHHRTGLEAYHVLGPKEFARVHDLDIPAIVRKLSTRPLIRVVGPYFIGYLDDYEYHLGLVKDGLKPAVRRLLNLCRESRAA